MLFLIQTKWLKKTEIISRWVPIKIHSSNIYCRIGDMLLLESRNSSLITVSSPSKCYHNANNIKTHDSTSYTYFRKSEIGTVKLKAINGLRNFFLKVEVSHDSDETNERYVGVCDVTSHIIAITVAVDLFEIELMLKYALEQT